MNTEKKAWGEERFRPVSVSDLIDGQHKFWIPSFQRGYRWEPQQVEDLLEDIFLFAKDINQSTTVYYLQPLVVRKHKDGGSNEWDILDGQQRLTTLYLILTTPELQGYTSRINEQRIKECVYSLNYDSKDRTIDWDNIDSLEKIDYYYILRAKRKILDWLKKNKDQTTTLDSFLKCLCSPDNKKNVKFIWYEVDEKESEELNSIEVFNRLNKGKIKLTSSELIKALFVICKKSKGAFESIPFATDWDVKEKQFQDDKFWHFICKDRNVVQTRMDLLFDFVYEKEKVLGNTTETDAYRFFQEKYNNGKTEFPKLWEGIVDEVYNKLIQWYEDIRTYNYIGYLVHTGISPFSIFNDLEKEEKKDSDWDLPKTYAALSGMISEQLKDTDLDTITYRDMAKVRKILLLFNIESYTRSDRKFPFDKYVEDQWDIEHVDSQSGSTALQSIEEKKQWLSFVLEGLEHYNLAEDSEKKAVEEIKCRVEKQLETLKEDNKDSNESFKEVYNLVREFQSITSDDEIIDEAETSIHGLGNLTLLNCQMNRSYQDAPYPYKRYKIIERDKSGKFVPLCTKNLFLKYYSGGNYDSTQMDIVRWRKKDKENYLQAIKDILNPFLK